MQPRRQAMALFIRLTDDEESRLADLARRTGRSKTFYVRQAIELHLGELEEHYWADTVIGDREAAGKPHRPAAEVSEARRCLGIWQDTGAIALATGPPEASTITRVRR